MNLYLLGYKSDLFFIKLYTVYNCFHSTVKLMNHDCCENALLW